MATANERLLSSAQARRCDPLLAELLTLYESSRSDPVRRWRCDRVFRRTAFMVALRLRDWRMIAHLAVTWPGFLWRGVLLHMTPKIC